MKKILSLILVLALVLSLGACTKRPEESKAPAEPDKVVDSLPSAEPSEAPGSSEPAPAETPDQQPDEAKPAPSEEPQESPEPSSEPEDPEESPEPSEEPKEPSVNEGKLDSSATVSSTATDLAPVDSSLLALIPELPFEGWASTMDGDSLVLELKELPSDVQSKLMEYIQLLRDEDFEVTEYIYGSLYEAVKTGVTVNIMLEGGKLTVLIEGK